MAEKHLGPAFEIHGGGNDLRFPHHENERAQSCSLGHPFAQIWMHNGMLELDAEKMSKSLGNVVTLQNVLDTWGRETLLVYLLTAHWRKPVDFSDDVLEQAAAQVGGVPERLPHSVRAGRRRRLGALRGCARRRLLDAGGARGHARMARPRAPRKGARPLRARVARRAGGAAGRGRCAGGGARGCSRERRLRDGRQSSGRDSGARLGGARRGRTASNSSQPRGEPRARLRPPAGLRGAAWPTRRARAPCERAGAALGDVASRRRRTARAGRSRARAHGARRHARPPGHRRPLRALPVRRRVRAGASAAAAARLPRRRDRSAQPRRRLPERGGGRSDRPRAARTPLRACHAGRLPRLRGRRRASAGRRRPEPRPLRRGREGPRALGVRSGGRSA